MRGTENKTQPVPQGKYTHASRHGNFIYTAGITPRRNGKLIQTGKIKSTEPISAYRERVVQATMNALAAAESMLKEDEKL